MAVGLIGIIPNSALAGTFDGSQPVICAVIETFECGEGASCERGLAESINFPQFIKIDFKTKSVTGTLPNGMVRTAEIKYMEEERVRKNKLFTFELFGNPQSFAGLPDNPIGRKLVGWNDDIVSFLERQAVCYE